MSSNRVLPEVVYEEVDYDTVREKYGSWAAEFFRKLYLRTILSERQNHKCCYCGRETNNIHGSRLKSTLEHVIPESRGGATDLFNCVVACSKCNNKRATTYLTEEELVHVE